MRGHCAPPFASKCTILDFFRFKNNNFGYRRYMLRPHLLCFVYHQGFKKNYFLSNSFFIRDHTFMPTTRKKGWRGVGTWNLSRACGFYCFYTTYMLFYFADGGGFSQNWFFVDVTHVWRFTQPDSGCSFFFPYFSPIMEFEVHGGSNRKNIDRSCITNEQCE